MASSIWVAAEAAAVDGWRMRETRPKDLVRTLKDYWNCLEYPSIRSSMVRFLFEDYTLDIDRRELTRATAPISIGPQVFDLLVYLVQHCDRVVSKDNLFEIVWQGRTVSESTLTSHINAARKAIGDNGDEQRLIRTIARKGFRFVGKVSGENAAAESSSTWPTPTSVSVPSLTPPDRPSIAVLPFQNLSGDPEQEYFADGIVEDIITALSRMRWLFVIARNSSFTYKGRSVDVKQVGRELGVRYVLEGSVRKAANRVRISGQLIDASTGTSLWANHFDGALDDIFDLQDQVTETSVGAIAPKLEQAEIDRAKRKPTDSLDAYDYFLRGMACFYKFSREANSEALRLFLKAIELDPDFASAYGMAAWCYTWRKINGWMTDRVQEIAEGSRLAWRAGELGKDDAVALARGGHALGFLVGDLDSGAAFVDRALLLNPNLATAWVLSGLLRNYRGETDVAIDHLAHAMRLSPLDPTLYQMRAGTGLAHLLAGRFDDALSWAEKAFLEEPNYLPAAAVSAASHSLAGRLEEARQAMACLRKIDPALRMSNLKDWFPIRRKEHYAMWATGLRNAGLPE
jgi:TolB-like protein